MKKLITIILMLTCLTAFGQTTYQLNYDSIRVGKTAGTGGTSLYGKVYLKSVGLGNISDSILTILNGKIRKVKNSGSGNYIQNQTGANLAAQTAKFWVTDTIKTSATFIGNLTGNASTATISSTSEIVDDNTTNASMNVLWSTAGGSSSYLINKSSSKLLFNPFTGALTASNLSGTNTGDQNLSGYVPYTGATGAVDLGINTITSGNGTFGVAKAGTWASSTDYAVFGRLVGLTDYALVQNSSGATMLNAASGGSLVLRLGNSNALLLQSGLATFSSAVALGANNLTLTGSISSNLSRVTKGWFTDLEVTNAIAGSITGSAPTLTTTRTIWGQNFNGSANVSGALTGVTDITGTGQFSAGLAKTRTWASNTDYAVWGQFVGGTDYAIAQNGSAFTILNGSTLSIRTGNTPAIGVNASQAIQFNAYGAGTLTTDASGNITATSDERLKNISKFYTSGLSALKNIKPITYKWKAETKLDTVNNYTGFSAQNIEANIPDAVGKMKNGDLTIQERPIMATMVNAINELNEKIIALEARIKVLENKP